MAKPKKSVKKQASKKPTMRELANKKTERKSRKTLASKVKTAAKRPFKKSSIKDKKNAGRLGNSKIGKVFKKIGKFIVPAYFRNSWQEIRKVTWPSRRETIRLSFAVFVFSAVFAVVVAGLDFVLDKIFRELIIRG